MEFKHNYTRDEMNKYNVTLDTLDAKQFFKERNMVFLIEGLDQVIIDELKSTDQLRKQNQRGPLYHDGKEGIITQSKSASAEHEGYLLLEKITLKSDANLLVARSSGIPGENGFTDISGYSKRSDLDFLLQGYLYKVDVDLLK